MSRLVALGFGILDKVTEESRLLSELTTEADYQLVQFM